MTVTQIEKGWYGAVIAVWFVDDAGDSYCIGDRGLVRDWRGAVIEDPAAEIGAQTLLEMRARAASQGLKSAYG